MQNSNNNMTAEYELILAARNNDELAFEQLYKAYLPSVFGCVSSFQVPASEKDDLVQEGVIGFLKAVRTYDNSSSSFPTYASLCIKRSVISALRKYSRVSRFMGTSELLEEKGTSVTPESQLIGREEDRQHYLQFIKNLSEFERKTLTLYISGMSYASMAEKLSCPVKSVDNAITRIKRKIKNAKCGNTP